MNNEFTDTVDEGELLQLLKFLKTKKTKKFDSIKCDYGTKESLVDRVVWKGGSESSTFNRLEEIAMTNFPSTPVLKAEITRALDTRLIGRNYLTSRSCDRRSYITLLLLTTPGSTGWCRAPPWTSSTSSWSPSAGCSRSSGCGAGSSSPSTMR